MLPNMKPDFLSTFLLLVFFCSGALPVAAQYIEPEPRHPGSARFLYAGIFHAEFQPAASNSLTDSSRIEFSRIMPLVGLREGPVDVILGYTRFRLRGESREGIVFAARFSTDVMIAGNRSSSFLLPLSIAADYTKAEAPGRQSENFHVGSLGVGGGLKFRQIFRAAELTIGTAGAAHFSFEGAGSGTGFSSVVTASAECILPGALIADGIAFGYRFRRQTWSMSDDRFDYRALFHGPFLGVMF